MKSLVFTKQDLDREKLSKDVEAVDSLSSDKLRVLADFLSSPRRIHLRDEVLGDDLWDMLRSHDIGVETFHKARNLVGFLVAAMDEHDDDARAVVEDMADVFPPRKDRAAEDYNVYGFLSDVTESAKAARHERKRARAYASGAPTLDAVGFSTNLRAIPEKKFNPLTDDPANHHPTIVGLIPVVLMRLTTDRDDKMSFQLDVKSIDKLISCLRAARNELASLSEALSKQELPVESMLEEGKPE